MDTSDSWILLPTINFPLCLSWALFPVFIEHLSSPRSPFPGANGSMMTSWVVSSSPSRSPVCPELLTHASGLGIFLAGVHFFPPPLQPLLLLATAPFLQSVISHSEEALACWGLGSCPTYVSPDSVPPLSSLQSAVGPAIASSGDGSVDKSAVKQA